MTIDIVDELRNPESYWPGNFNTPERANAYYSALCQQASEEIERLRLAIAGFEQTVTDPDLWLMQDFARRLVEVTPLTEAEEQVIGLCVIQGCTLKEAGEMIGKTQERVRQILNKGLRRLRTHQAKLTGIMIETA